MFDKVELTCELLAMIDITVRIAIWHLHGYYAYKCIGFARVDELEREKTRTKTQNYSVQNAIKDVGSGVP